MEYAIIDDKGNDTGLKASFKELIHNSMVAKYGDRCINHGLAYWIQKYKVWFDPIKVNMLAKKMSIYQQDREYNINYANLTETVKMTRTEPSRNASLADDKPTSIDINERNLLQPAGPLGNANMIKDSMDSIEHPLALELYGMEVMFIREEIVEDMLKWRC